MYKIIKQSIGAKLVLGIILSILPFLVVFILILNHLAAMNKLAERSLKHLNELRRVDEARASLPLAVKRLDHYIIAAGPTELARFRRSLKQAGRDLDVLVRVRTFNSKERLLINEARQHWRRAGEAVGDVDTSTDRRQLLRREDIFDAEAAAILPRLARVNDNIWLEIGADTEKARTTGWRLVLFMALALAAELIIIVFLVVIAKESVILPLVELTSKVESVAAGNFSARVIVDKTDELGILGRKFNNMAAGLENALADVRAEEERFRSIADTAVDAIVISDSSERIIFWNHAAVNLFGYSIKEALGKSLTLIMPQRYRAAHRRGFKLFLTTGRRHIIGKVVRLEGLRKDKTEFPLELSLAAWSSKGERFFSAVIRDITWRKRYEDKLKYLAEHDGLTGLLNQTEFYRRLEKELSRARRYNSAVSLLIADVDDFKKINDKFGHIAGDKVLRKLADSLKNAVRRADTVARYGGEEFAVILPMINGAEARRSAERICALTAALEVESGVGRSVGLTISIGVSTFPGDGDSAATLVTQADKALYRAKRLGKNRVA